VGDLAAVHAQVITGDVKDASGAVLPGVTVEVSSRRSSKKYGPSSPTAWVSPAS
jgi:hypothetical protein